MIMCKIIIYIDQWWSKCLVKKSLINHSSPWDDKPFVPWTLKQTKTVLHTGNLKNIYKSFVFFFKPKKEGSYYITMFKPNNLAAQVTLT